MIETIILFVICFIIGVISVYYVKNLNKQYKIVGNDVNKKGEPIVSESCGIALLIPIFLGVLYYLFVFNRFEPLIWFVLIALFGIVGFLDDNKHKFLSTSMGWAPRAIPTIGFALVFCFLYAPTNFWIIPLTLFIVGLAAFQNSFAGLNGWEVGSGFIISLFVVFLLIQTPYSQLSIVLSAAIFALLIFNKYPAKVFPGDSGTLLIGCSIGGLIVLTQNLELVLIVLLFYIPHFIDFFILKLLTNLKDPSQSKFRPYKVLKDGKLTIPKYPDKIERLDFAKLIMKIFGPLHEWQIVIIIHLIVIVNCFIVLFLFGKI